MDIIYFLSSGPPVFLRNHMYWISVLPPFPVITRNLSFQGHWNLWESRGLLQCLIFPLSFFPHLSIAGGYLNMTGPGPRPPSSGAGGGSGRPRTDNRGLICPVYCLVSRLSQRLVSLVITDFLMVQTSTPRDTRWLDPVLIYCLSPTLYGARFNEHPSRNAFDSWAVNNCY